MSAEDPPTLYKLFLTGPPERFSRSRRLTSSKIPGSDVPNSHGTLDNHYKLLKIVISFIHMNSSSRNRRMNKHVGSTRNGGMRSRDGGSVSVFFGVSVGLKNTVSVNMGVF